MHPMTTRSREPVDLAGLARELGLSRPQRQDLLAERLVTPVSGEVRKGQRTKITAEDADRLTKAARIATITGVAVIIVMRLLASGAVKPNVP